MDVICGNATSLIGTDALEPVRMRLKMRLKEDQLRPSVGRCP